MANAKISAAIENAKKAAAASAPPPPPAEVQGQQPRGDVAVIPPNNGGALATPGRRMTADDFINNSRAAVDVFLKVSEHGLTLGSDKTLLDNLSVVIDLNHVAYCMMVRFGKPVQYLKTYDGKTVPQQGISWSDALARAKAWAQNITTDPFQTADIVFICQETVKAKDKKTVIADVGTRIGYSPPYTGAPYWSNFLKEVIAAGFDKHTARIKATLGFEPKKNNDGQEWGIVTYEFEGEAEPEEEVVD